MKAITLLEPRRKCSTLAQWQRQCVNATQLAGACVFQFIDTQSLNPSRITSVSVRPVSSDIFANSSTSWGEKLIVFFFPTHFLLILLESLYYQYTRYGHLIAVWHKTDKDAQQPSICSGCGQIRVADYLSPRLLKAGQGTVTLYTLLSKRNIYECNSDGTSLGSPSRCIEFVDSQTVAA